MKGFFPGLKLLVPFGVVGILAGMFSYSVNADSTITIPVPERAAADKSVTLSLRIPPNTEPVTKPKEKLKLSSARSLIQWNANPSPKIEKNDELLTIIDTINEKGWLKTYTSRNNAKLRPMDKYIGVRLVEEMARSIIEIAQSPNVTRVIRKCNLTASDIEDVRRMVQRFSTELVMFGVNPKNYDKDLLMLQERFKTAKS
ncbi:MAG TPA: hypothetical protein PLY73_05515, partial [Candidatus Ozemobacteraceae bacterium]|nr:hypothetical protein [Candidatus Ozemobacteraceae bacterium]